MTGSPQSITKAIHPRSSALWFGVGLMGLTIMLLLEALGVRWIILALVLAAGALTWLAWRHPTFCLGAVLVFMSIDPLAVSLARFFGPPLLMSDAFKASDRLLLLLPTCVLWWRNGIKLKAPDLFLLACFGLAVVRLIFGGSLVPLLYDFDLIIAYLAGRVAVLTISRQTSWARRAVWIVAVLSVLGMVEVFFIGEGPRTLLYLVAQEGATESGALNASFHASGFQGLRESATMIGPLQFGALCMVGLILWFVYYRNPLPAAMIASGLICTLSRSSWLGTLVAIPLLAVVMRRGRRLVLYGVLATALLMSIAAVAGIGDFLSLTASGQEYSEVGHVQSLFTGLAYVLSHPFGDGPGNAGMWALKSNENLVWIENSYLTLAAEYGIATVLCFIGFFASAFWTVWQQRTQLAYAAMGILAGFSAVISVVPVHDVFCLAAWVWFPVGLAIQSSSKGRLQLTRNDLRAGALDGAPPKTGSNS